MSKEKVLRVLTEVSRFLLAVTFIFSGTVKSIDPVGGILKVTEYLSAFGMDSLSGFSLFISFNLSALEFALGVCLLMGVYRRLITSLMLLFMCVMMPLTLYLALFNPVSDCGCFGDAIVLTNWQTFWKNVVLLAAAVMVFIYNRQIFPFYTYRVNWFIVLFSFLFGLFLSYYNYNHLPIIDFRPYKVGENMLELMEVPEGAPEDEYAYSFLYEKGGVQKEFALEEIPSDDSTWVFVESKTELVSQGYVPKVPSFHVYNKEGEEVGAQLWDTKGPLLLLVSYKLDQADDRSVDDINDIYDYAQEKAIPFYCLTSSSKEDMENWRDYTGADYPFLIADETQLKTVIRSNPGLMLLNDGTILMKKHSNDIPEENELAETIDKYLQGYKDTDKERERVYFILAFIVPLLLVWIYDFFRLRPILKKSNETKQE